MFDSSRFMSCAKLAAEGTAMTDITLRGPDAQARVDRACEGADWIMASAHADADRIEQSWMATRIQPDLSDVIEAKRLAESALIEGRTLAMRFYFDAVAYEHFLFIPGVAFASALENLAAETKRMYPGDSKVLREAQQRWALRVADRTILLASTFERAPQLFWRELRVEFGRLDGADLKAVLKGNGWWKIEGGPPDPAAQRTLCLGFGVLVRRALAALGFTDRSVAIQVWLDSLKRESSHAVAWGVDNLLLACQDYCSQLEPRSGATVSPASAAGPPKRKTEIKGPGDKHQTALGRNIDGLRKECGWSFVDLALRSGIDKTAILDHVNKGSCPRPSTLKIYADTFSKRLNRLVTVAELEA
jgi:hypothetical protein